MARKAQAAMEFLMTYGWAILVVLVVIGALAYFGVLNPTRLLPPKCTFPTGINCRDFVVSDSGESITVKLINGMGRDIYIRSLEAVPQAGNTAASGTCMQDYGAGSEQIIANGQSIDITVDCAAAGETITSTAADAKYRWDLNLVMFYADSDSTFSKTLIGELLTNVEP